MKTITRQQYYTLIGLREVAKKQWLILEELSKAAIEITGENKEAFSSHADDFIHGSRDLGDMLRILEIKID